MDELKNFLDKFYRLEVDSFEALSEKFRPLSAKRGEMILREGEIQKDLLFVEAGTQMSYSEKGDKLHVMAFTYPPSLSGIPDSFFMQTPSDYSLQALSASAFLAISHGHLNELFNAHPDIERLFRKITEVILSGMIRRHYELQALSMEERFIAFAKRSPHLFTSVPHKYIASYLNIDPTNFSKLYNSIRI